MPSTNLCGLLIFLVAFQGLVAEAELDGTCSGTAGAGGTCSSDEANAALCNNADPAVCLCNINYVVADTDCALIDCTDGTSTPTDVCNGGNTACTKDTSKCSCIANFETLAASPTTCTQIPCTTETVNLCTDQDANSYCVALECVCKINFIGTERANCERSSCANDGECTLANSACHKVTDVGCGCDTLFTADATTGACTTRKPCTDDTTVAATCGLNTVCELSGNAYKCFCKANYLPSVTGCIRDACATTSDCIGNDEQCTSLECECADTFTASGSICKRICSSDANTCDATNAACVSSVCECNVNFQGDGATCAAITGCTESDVSVCHPNSRCDTADSDTCKCLVGWVIDGTVCKKSCTAGNAATMCDANASCVSEKCECNVNYIGDGSTCTQKTCNGTDIANCVANSICSTDKCTCADNFVGNSQACECPTGFSVVGGSCKKSCTDNTGCGTKGACFNSSCECEPNYMGNAATACTQIACNGTDATACVAKSKCESDKCVCTAGYFVAENDQPACGGCEGIFCNFSLLMTSLLMFFFASKRFE